MSELETTAADSSARSVRLGTALGLASAALFGVSTPLAKRLLAEAPPQMLAGLLYLGAGVALSLLGGLRRRSREAPLRRADALPLAGVIVLGGLLGPLLLLVGLARVTAVSASLLLNLEAPFTIAVAVLAFGEHLGRRAAVASGFILLGALVLQLQPGELRADAWGIAAVAAACACWAIDNNLTQQLSLRDPVALVRIKALAAGTGNLLLAAALGATCPRLGIVLAAMLVGAISYGASVVLDTYALRLLGAAREAALFATAPFAGALASVALIGEKLATADLAAMGLMAAGVVVLLRDRHGHEHAHAALAHEHLHVHDEHHRHEHTPSDPPGEPHSHPHRHAPLVHGHPHVPDLHHRHEH